MGFRVSGPGVEDVGADLEDADSKILDNFADDETDRHTYSSLLCRGRILVAQLFDLRSEGGRESKKRTRGGR
jgi:hypothetical protein